MACHEEQMSQTQLSLGGFIQKYDAILACTPTHPHSKIYRALGFASSIAHELIMESTQH